MINFSINKLYSLITKQCKTHQSFLIAYSGGLDSHVLLHALANLQQQKKIATLRTIHINHGLQKEAKKWEIHCLNVCEKLKIPCQVIELNLHIPKER